MATGSSKRRVASAKNRPTEDLIAAYGSGGVGARLRRLSERIDREARSVYEHFGLEFEQRNRPGLGQRSRLSA